MASCAVELKSSGANTLEHVLLHLTYQPFLVKSEVAFGECDIGIDVSWYTYCRDLIMMATAENKNFTTKN
jgi:hypothetical protein